MSLASVRPRVVVTRKICLTDARGHDSRPASERRQANSDLQRSTYL